MQILKKLREQIIVIQARYNWEIEESQKIAVVVSIAGKNYADIIQHKTMGYEVKSIPVAVWWLIKAMHEIYCLLEEEQTKVTVRMDKVSPTTVMDRQHP
jgi:hypothetical protein